MVETTWNMAKSINEGQDGHEKSEYGTDLLTVSSKKVTQDFCKRFSVET